MFSRIELGARDVAQRARRCVLGLQQHGPYTCSRSLRLRLQRR